MITVNTSVTSFVFHSVSVKKSGTFRPFYRLEFLSTCTSRLCDHAFPTMSHCYASILPTGKKLSHFLSISPENSYWTAFAEIRGLTASLLASARRFEQRFFLSWHSRRIYYRAQRSSWSWTWFLSRCCRRTDPTLSLGSDFTDHTEIAGARATGVPSLGRLVHLRTWVT